MMKGEDINLRALELKDADFMYELENRMQLWHLSNTRIPVSKLRIEDFIERSSNDLLSDHQWRICIEENSSGECVGFLDFFDYDPVHLRAFIGIIITDEKQNKGYASQALELILPYAAKTLRLHQLAAEVLELNEASIRLFEKAGFKKVGLKKDWVWTGEAYENEVLLQKIL
jgi:diamine N-acetyltransferase